jgi:hypothetical protein
MWVRSTWVSDEYSGPQTSTSNARCVSRRPRWRVSAEQLELDRRQMHVDAAGPDGAGGEIDFEAVRSDDRLLDPAIGAAQRRLKAGDELARPERLVT